MYLFLLHNNSSHIIRVVLRIALDFFVYAPVTQWKCPPTESTNKDFIIRGETYTYTAYIKARALFPRVTFLLEGSCPSKSYPGFVTLLYFLLIAFQAFCCESLYGWQLAECLSACSCFQAYGLWVYQ